MDFNEQDELQEEQKEEIQDNSNDEINENEPVSESDSSDSEIIEGPIENAKAQMSKKDYKKLIKISLFGGVAAIISLIFIGLILYTDFDLFGVGEPKPTYYQGPACGKVFLTGEDEEYLEKHHLSPTTNPAEVDLSDTERFHYEEYDYDTYISGIVWTDNKNVLDVDNEVVYQAMGVAARSRLISELPDNCVVLRDYNEQAKSFTKLDGSEEKYTEITQAVQATKGIIIGRDNIIIDARYDAFSYTKKGIAEEEPQDSNFFYHMMNENEEGTKVIPGDWVDDIAKSRGLTFRTNVMKHVNDTNKFGSMSLYGAKYLLEKKDSLYELYRILETYYGRDIEYYTIFSAFSNEYNFNSGYSLISMKSTTLSREEFIRLVQIYGNSKGGGAKTLADNAGMIYDMAVANGINPELVLEGYSPGASKNNYWGYGCTNTGGYEACKSYSSLSEGVSAFLQFVAKFNTLTELMSVYAYLGDYWYNPGSWGTGGCVYASAIYGSDIPERVRNACASGKTCTTAGGGDCVATTDEDKEAYLVYQSQSMINARKKIFGLDADIYEPSGSIGEPGVGTCTIFAQSDPRWGILKLGNSKSTVSGSGCAVTSVAIAISCSGTQINNVANFNPGTLVRRMNAIGGFSGANIYWSNKAITEFAPSFQFVKTLKMEGWSNDRKLNELKSSIGNNISAILHFKNEAHPRGHYVVLKSILGNNFVVYDPAGGKINTYSVNDFDGFVTYRY